MKGTAAEEARTRFNDYMAGRSGSFFSLLFSAMFHADRQNMMKLAKSFPDEARCVAEYKGYHIVPGEEK